MLVVGIDPGERKTGMAWIRRGHHGDRVSRATTVIFATQNRLHIRWVLLSRKIEGFFRGIPEAPVTVAVEAPEDYVRDGVPLASILRLHAAYAVIVAAAARLCPGANLLPLPARSWNGGLRKSDTWERMERKYKGRLTSDDAADALGIADFAYGVAVKVQAAPGLPAAQAGSV